MVTNYVTLRHTIYDTTRNVNLKKATKNVILCQISTTRPISQDPNIHTRDGHQFPTAGGRSIAGCMATASGSYRANRSSSSANLLISSWGDDWLS
ncbi:hypothetical protein TorRG33x02_050190 [Trema orientale]|uniref:Uncharacterized protein n=1 Tax=Trema orientale TaxID=63057 RepID=A0A2P5FN00_TREOI|nr:hypothetical protein TorRG33x02_050190 [Trema orientale]